MGTKLYKPGDAYGEELLTRDSDGISAAPDSTPSAKLYRNGAYDSAVPITAALVSGETALYSLTGTIPTTYAAGDRIAVKAAATVGGFTTEDLDKFKLTTGGDAPAVDSSGSVAAYIAPADASLVHNPRAAGEQLLGARTYRLVLLDAGTSNQLFNGDGNDYGWGKACSDLYGLFATGMVPMNPNSNSAWPAAGYFSHQGGSATYTVAPAGLAKYSLNGIGSTQSQPYLYIPFGNLDSGYTGNLEAGFPGIDEALRWHGVCVLDPNGGTIQPHANLSSGATINDGPPISLAGTATGLVRVTHDIPAGSRGGNGVDVTLMTPTGGNNIPGLVFMPYQQIERTGKTNGVSNTTFLFGAVSLASHADDLDALAAADNGAGTGIKNYLSRLVDLQESPRVLCIVEHFQHDVDAGAATFAANALRFISTLRGQWEALGFPTADLRFLFTTEHPQSGTYTVGGVTKPRVQWQSEFEEALIDALCAANEEYVTVVRSSRMTTPAAIRARGGFSGLPGDDAHKLAAEQAYEKALLLRVLERGAAQASDITALTTKSGQLDSNVVSASAAGQQAIADALQLAPAGSPAAGSNTQLLTNLAKIVRALSRA
jgi:hypothetical protein